MKTQFCRLAIVISVVLGLNLTTQAQTNFVWTNATSGAWSTAGKWNPSTPGAGGSNDYVITFNTNTTLVTTNDLGAPNFLLNQLVFNTGTVTIFGGAGTNLVFTNNSSGVLPQINQNSAATSSVAIGVILATNLTFTGNGAGPLIVSGVVSGSSGITKSGSHKLVLTGANSFTNGTTITAGTLNINADAALGAVPSPAATNITFTGAGTLQFNAGFTVNANRTIFLNGVNSFFDPQANTNTINSTITGTGSLTKVGSGQLNLAGTNTYSGGTAVNAGFLQFSNLNAVPTTGFVSINSGGTLRNAGAYTTVTDWLNSGRLATASPGVLAWTASSAETIDFTGAGGGNYTNLVLGAIGNLTYSGTLTPPANNIYRLGGGGGTLNLTNDLLLTGANRLVAFSGGSSGTLVISGSNDFTGGTTLSGGTVSINSDVALGAVPVSPATNLTVTASATLQLTTNMTLAANRTLLLSGGTTTIDPQGNTVTLPGAIVGSGALTKAGTSTSTLYLTGTNTFTGAVNINLGALWINNSQGLGISNKTVTATSNVNDTELHLDGSGGNIIIPATIAFKFSNDTLGTGGDGTLFNEAGTNTVLGPITLTSGGGGTRINVISGFLTLAGNIAPDQSLRVLFLRGEGNGEITGVIADFNSSTPLVSVTKDAGNGTWTLSATNTYRGNTIVNAGTLRLGPTGSINSSTNIFVNSPGIFNVADVNGGYTLLGHQNLIGTGTVTGNVTVATNAKLRPGDTGTIGALTFANDLTLNSASTNFFDLGTTASDLISVGGSLTNGGSIVSVSMLTPLTNGTYTLLSYGAGKSGTFATTVSGNLTRKILTLDETTAGQINLIVDGSFSNITWQPTANGNWDLTTSNWLSSAGTDLYFDFDTVNFTDAGAGTNPIAIAGTVRPSAIIVNSSSNYTFSGAGKISGTTGILKDGPGVLTVSTTGGNDFTGDIIISNGLYKVGNAGGVGASNGATRGVGGTFDINGVALTNTLEQFFIAGTGLNSTGAVINSGAQQTAALSFLTLTADASIGSWGNRWDVRGAQVNNGFVNLGGFTLTKVGGGSIFFTDILSTNAGNININQGSLAIARGVTTGSGSINVASGAVLELASFSTGSIDKAIALSNATLNVTGNSMTLGSPVTLSDSNTFNPTNLTMTASNVWSGTGSLTKLGTGTLAFTSTNNNYTGPTTISAGTVRLGDGAGNDGLITSDVINNGALIFSNVNAQTYGGTISGTGSVAKGSGGLLALTGPNTYSGLTTISGGTLQIGDGGTSGALGTSNVVNNSLLAFNRSDTLLFTNITSGTGRLVQSGSGTTILAGPSYTYTGGTLAQGGTLVLSNGVLINTPFTVTNGATVLAIGSGTGLVGEYYNIRPLNANGLTTGSLPSFNSLGALNSNFAFTNANLLFNGSPTSTNFTFGTTGTGFPPPYASGATLFEARWVGQFNATTNGTYVFGISSDDGAMLFIDGGIVVNKNGFGGIGAPTYGSVNLSTGVHQIVYAYFQGTGGYGFTNSLALPGGATNVIPMSTFATGPYVGALSGTADTTLQISNSILTVNQTADGTFAGALNGDGILRKIGSAVLELTGTNSLLGGAQVNGGTLRTSYGTGFTDTAPLTLDGGVWETSQDITNAIGATGGQVRLPVGLGGFSAFNNPITVNLGGATGTVAWGNANFNPDVLALNGPVANTNLTFLNPLDLNGSNVTRTIGVYANVATITGVITNSGTGLANLTKTGAGTLILTANSTYNGATLINGGTLTMTLDNALPTSTALTVGDALGGAASLDLSANNQTVRSLLIGTTSAAVTNNIIIGTNQTFTVNGNVLIGPTLPTSNTYATVALFTGAGTLQVSTNGGRVQIGGYTGAVASPFGDTVNADLSGLATATINLGTTGLLQVGDATSGGAGGGTGASVLRLATNTTITAGNVNVGVGGAGLVQTLFLGSGATVINANNINLALAQRDSGRVAFSTSGGTLTVRAADGVGRAAFTMATGNPNTGFIATNSFDVTGHTVNLLLSTLTIGEQGRSGFMTNTFAFDTGTIDTLGIRLGNRLQGGGGSTYNNVLNLGGGTVIVGSNGIVMATNIGTASGATNNAFLNISGAAVTVSNNITMLTQSSAVAAVNSTINLTAGSLTVLGDIVKGAPTNSPAANTATINVNGGLLDLQNHNLGSAARTLDNLNFQSGTVQNIGEINGGLSGLTKTGAGNLILAGSNTYTGATLINAGTLTINGQLMQSAVTVTSGTLGGTGFIAQAVTITSGGTLSPGSSIGALSIGSNLTATNLTLQGITLMEISKSPALTNDAITVAGLLNFGGTLVVTNLGGTLAGGDVFQLFNFGGAANAFGTFAATNFPDLSVIDPSLTWDTSHLYDLGQLAIIPEPSALTLAAFGLAGALLLRRRRQS